MADSGSEGSPALAIVVRPMRRNRLLQTSDLRRGIRVSMYVTKFK
jgi:hypothetical protein